ncbi:MAG: hypothetical protein GY820_28000, partial [Gammaproteobacteria bacterium]|nr:hypothetical protein [Gammaproteobacteria bacterium]
MKQTQEKVEKNEIQKKIIAKLANDLYVDNIVTGADTIQQALRLYEETRKVFGDASMNVREWVSNSSEVMKLMPMYLREDSNPIKVLGIIWNHKQDNFSITTITTDIPGKTKREVLSQMASRYINDPMGLFSPIILPAKLFIKELWNIGFDWDEEMLDELKQKWFTIFSSLSKLHQHKLPRYLGLGSKQPTEKSGELIAFVDASKSAYACCIYLKLKAADDSKTTANLVCSKTRLSGNHVTITRVEMLAMLISCRALKYVKKELNIKIEAMTLFSDSNCALAWIKTEKSLSTFVHNRVKEIRENQDLEHRWISGEQNPADVASRGATISELMDNVSWWKGPEWLLKNSPELESFERPAPDVEEMKQIEKELTKGTISNIVIDMNEMSFIEIDRFSSLTRLLNTTVYVLRFIKRHILGNKPKE